MRVAVFLLVAFAAVATCAAAKPGSKPSFLFILGDDIGWADFGYNNGTAFTPNLDAWATAEGSILMQDMHSGGTVCSPTRATVLTGRNHFRDCVDYVYGCSDMTECVPSFEFAPQHTFTIGDAARAAGSEYSSFFGGKWHLGSFYNDSEKLGGRTSSPISHGFDHMNATVEVAPTATTNCQCRQDWDKECLFGHYKKPTHCSGGANPGGGSLPRGCCFNYWWEDQEAEHGVTNLTNFVPQDDSQYTHSSFVKFIDSIDGNPFLAQLSFHNCHIPFIGTEERRQACAQNKTCKPPLPGSQPYTDEELDFYACISELDNAIGDVLQLLKDRGYYDNTMIWLATDNGPEENCHPEGICKGTEHRPQQGAGSAGPLRGRKRDIWVGSSTCFAEQCCRGPLPRTTDWSGVMAGHGPRQPRFVGHCCYLRFSPHRHGGAWGGAPCLAVVVGHGRTQHHAHHQGRGMATARPRLVLSTRKLVWVMHLEVLHS
eukprot:m.325608 g.325608  ORF g.325608 m.325608 type:complete len:485 (-) comp19735_c0_seq20:112-1566(-)